MQDSAVPLDPLQVVAVTVALVYGPSRPTRQHIVHFRRGQTHCAGASDACRNMREKRVGKTDLQRFDALARQPRQQRSHAARDIKTDPTCGDDPACARIECGYAANRKAIPPMRVGHRIRRAYDAGQACNVADLFEHFVVHALDQPTVAENDAGHAHAVARVNMPFEFAVTGLLAEFGLIVSGPRFMKGMAGLGCPNFIDFYRRGACFIINTHDEPDSHGLSGRVVLVSTRRSSADDPRQRFFQQTPIRRTLGVAALGQVEQFASHGWQPSRVRKSDQIEVRPFTLH